MQRLTVTMVAFVAFLHAGPAHAVGLFLPDKGRHIQLVEARVLLVWDADKKTQALTVQPVVTGNARSFAWVVATPKKQKLDEMPRDFFQALTAFTLLEPMDTRFAGNPEPPPFRFPPEPKEPRIRITDGEPVYSLEFLIFEPGQEDRLRAWGKKHDFDVDSFEKLLVPELKKGLMLTVLHADAAGFKRNKEGVFENVAVFPVRFFNQAEKPHLPLELTKHCVKDRLRLLLHTAAAAKLDLPGDLSYQPAWLEKWTHAMQSIAADKRTPVEATWLKIADREAPQWRRPLKKLAEDKRTSSMLRFAKRLNDEDMRVLAGKESFTREAPKAVVESMRHVSGHLKSEHFFSRIEAVLLDRECGVTIDLVPAQIGGKTDEIIYTALMPARTQ